MSTSPTVDPQAQGTPAATVVHADDTRPLLICLPPMTADTAPAVIAGVSAAFQGQLCYIASPDVSLEGETGRLAAPGLPSLLPYTQARGDGEWVLDTEDYVAAAALRSPLVPVRCFCLAPTWLRSIL